MWKRIDDHNLVFVVLDAEDDDFPRRPRKYVRTKCATLWKYEKLPPLKDGKIPQLRVTYMTQIDVNGVIPKSIVNSTGIKTLMYLSDIRHMFDKGREIDMYRRNEIVSSMVDTDFADEEVCSEFVHGYLEVGGGGGERYGRGRGLRKCCQGCEKRKGLV